MISINKLKQQWMTVTKVPNGYSQIDEDHPLEWRIGYDGELRKSLYVIIDHPLDQITSSAAFRIESVKKNDGKYCMFISLIDDKLEDVFIHMTIDLLIFTSIATDKAKATGLFKNRFLQWEKLFKKGWKDILSGEQQRGLIGELLFLSEILDCGEKSFIEALEGWFGPECEHQDFYYGEDWFEVKTMKENGEKIKISSLQQLSSIDKGRLVVYSLHKCGKSNLSFSLNSKVHEIKEKLADDIIALDVFNIKLALCGYIELPEYGEENYTIVSKKEYDVIGDFPRLTVNNVDPAIVSASYSLSIAALSKWEIKGNK